MQTIAKDENMKKLLAEHIEIISKEEQTLLKNVVATCKLSNAWEAGTIKIEMSFYPAAHQKFREVVALAFGADNSFQVKEGVAPRSGLERKLQELLDKASKIKE